VPERGTFRIFSISFSILVAGGIAGCSPSRQIPLDTLVASERAFAALSVARGTQTAFLTFLDDSAVIFRPHPVNGKEWFRGQAPRSTVLDWEPSFAECSSSGDLGYTTGPWRVYRSAKTEEPVAFGYFISVWGRRPGEGWKVLLDAGTSNPRPGSDSVTLRRGQLSQESAAEAGQERDLFENAERSFIRALGASDLAKAYSGVASPVCRFYRDGHFPALGLDEALRIIGDVRPIPAFTPLLVRASAAGDLAYVYGRYEAGGGGAPGEAGYYLRIWQRTGGSAALLLDLMSPLPPAK
jgi:ketosteroid isomerase-like protein